MFCYTIILHYTTLHHRTLTPRQTGSCNFTPRELRGATVRPFDQAPGKTTATTTAATATAATTTTTTKTNNNYHNNIDKQHIHKKHTNTNNK